MICNTLTKLPQQKAMQGLERNYALKANLRKNDNVFMQMYISAMIFIGIASHIFLAAYFFNRSLYVVAWVNVFDIFLWVIAYMLNRAGKTRVASFFCVFTLIVYSIAGTYLLGLGINLQWIVLAAVLPTALYFDFTIFQKIGLLVVVFIVVNVQMIVGELFPPPFPQYGNIFLTMFFGNVVILAILVELLLNVLINRKLAAEREKELEDVKQLSYIDSLTTLNNRRYANVYLERLRRDKLEKSSCFGLMDIDNFKSINDTYGHNVGDIALQKLGEILREKVRSTDLSCRWGGEEFLVILNNCDIRAGYTAFENIRKAVEQAVVSAGDHELKFTITCGVAVWNDEGIEKTLEDCDRNLYAGKRSGKNRVVV